MREGQLNSEARHGTGCGSRRRLKGFPGSQIGQAMASLAEEERKVALAGPGLLLVLLFLLLLRGNLPRCSVYRVLRDPWPGRLVPPYLLGTDGKPDREDQGQPDARRRKERTLTRVTHPWSGRIKG
jgi:hypothetical protein